MTTTTAPVSDPLRSRSDAQRAKLGTYFWQLAVSPFLLFIGCRILEMIQAARWRSEPIYMSELGKGVTELGGSSSSAPLDPSIMGHYPQPDPTYYLPIGEGMLTFLQVIAWLIIIVGVIALCAGLRVFLAAVDLWRAHRIESDEIARESLGAQWASLEQSKPAGDDLTTTVAVSSEPVS